MSDQWQEICQRILGQLEFVHWDRFFETGPQRAKFFGWIDRNDEYQDFVTVEIDFRRGEAVSYATSSAEYTERIAERLGMGHSDCKRVENHVHGLDNVMTLDASSEDNNRNCDDYDG